MIERQKVIYVAGTLQQAQILKNVLAEEGIEAVVSNEVLQGGSGVDVVGWSTAARVVVGEDDAPAARQIALELERQSRLSPGELDDEEVERTEVVHPWPQCPECSAPRPVQCPICQSIGVYFPEADADYPAAVVDEAKQSGVDQTGGGSCGCGSGGCGSPGEAARTPLSNLNDSGAAAPTGGDTPGAEQAHDDLPVPLMLLCPTCDEPFEPEHSRFCAWCEYDFGEGFDVEIETLPAEDLNPRVVAMIAVLVGVFVAAALYFAFVV